MTAGISLKRVWADEHVTEFEVTISDGDSMFVTRIYAGQDLADALEGLNRFGSQIHGGLYDLRLGAFGPEYANGALEVRLHFHERGRIYVTARAESSYEPFSLTSVASHGTLYFTTEPAALDNFIGELKTLLDGTSDEAHLWSY